MRHFKKATCLWVCLAHAGWEVMPAACLPISCHSSHSLLDSMLWGSVVSCPSLWQMSLETRWSSAAPLPPWSTETSDSSRSHAALGHSCCLAVGTWSSPSSHYTPKCQLSLACDPFKEALAPYAPSNQSYLIISHYLVLYHSTWGPIKYPQHICNVH